MVFFLVYAGIFYNSLGYRKKIDQQNKKLEELKNKLESFPENLDAEYKNILEKRKDYSTLIRVFYSIQRPYLDWNILFAEVSKALDPEVLIANIGIGFEDDGRMMFQIDGEYTGTFPNAQLTLRKVRLALEESKYFEDVILDIKRTAEVKIGETRKFNFLIAGHVEDSNLIKREL